MTPLDALAAAIRERLVSGRPAPLPGLGTLVRQHVSARVEERPDGSRVLLPPGETIGLAGDDDAHESLADAFGRFRALSEDEAPRAFLEAMDQVEARLAATGEVRLPGVGLLRRTSSGVVLGVEADLLTAVNRTFEGLAPVRTGPTPPPEPRPARPADEPTDEPDEPPPPAEGSPARAEGDAVAPSSPFDADQTVDLGEFVDTPPEAPPAVDTSEAEGAALAPDVAGPPAAFDVDDAQDEWTSATERPVAPRDEPPLDSLLLDEDTLDEDLDEDLDDVLAVPFGTPGGEALADLLPPTPHETGPEPDLHIPPPDSAAPEPEEDSPTRPSEDDWFATSWTTASAEPPLSSLGEGDADIEDAELVEDVEPGDGEFDEEVEPLAHTEDDTSEVSEVLPADPAAADPEATDPTDTYWPVPVDRMGPDAEFNALFPPTPPIERPAEPAPQPAERRPPVPSEPAAERPRAFPWWLLALLGLALVIAAVVWLWPRGADAPPGAEPLAAAPPGAEAEAETAPTVADSFDAPLGRSGADVLDDSFDALDDPNGAPASPAAPAPTPAAPRPRSASGAVLPPRVVGLDPEDVRALSGDPVQPAAEAWTFVVLSTSLRDVAQDFASGFRTAGYRTAVLEADAGARAQYRVAVGQFDSKDQALRLRDRLPPQAPTDTWLLDLRTL